MSFSIPVQMTVSNYIRPVYNLLGSAEFDVQNASSSETAVGTMNLDPAKIWFGDKILYIRCRDKAGARTGYFLETDTWFINYYAVNNIQTQSITLYDYAYRLMKCVGENSISLANTSAKYGVYPYSVGKDGRIVINCKYSNVYSGTINGTYVVEVYSLEFPNNKQIL